ncbi:MAG TPA: HupU protein, partial [Alteromonas sp.]|nr:HupU protein [Alteromonas sp.]
MLNLLWLQSGGCGGCSMSLLNAESPDVLTLFENAGINLLWHPSLSEATGDECIAMLEGILAGDIILDILCIEGSMMTGPMGTGKFHILGGTGKPMIEWVKALADIARYTVAVGSCAAYGCITAAGANDTDATGLQFDGEMAGGLLGKDFTSQSGDQVVNIAGCPVHPDWVTETLMSIALGEHNDEQLDK